MTTTSYNIYQQITSVRLASTANLAGNYFNGSINNGVGATLTALTVGHLSLDGVSVEIGDRLFLKDQTSTNQNGIYIVNAVGGSRSLWMIERSPDFQSIEQLKVGQYFTVGGGLTLAGSMYVLIEPLPSSIGLGSFSFENVADVVTPVGPFLLKSANLSDVNNSTSAIENIGLGRPGILILTDADFAAGGGTYTLTNPPPIYVSMSTTSAGRILQLPPQNEASSLQASQNITLLTGNPSQAININNGAGTLIFQVGQDSAWQAIPNDRTTIAAAWEFLGIVQTLSAVTGTVDLTSTDGSITIISDASNQTIDLSASASVVGGTDNIVWVGMNGSDIIGNGSFSNPYASISHAMISITTASSTNPFKIEIGDGVYTDVNLALKPWIFIDGNQCQYTVSGSVTLDPSWSMGGYLFLQNFFRLGWPATVTLDFNAISSPLSILDFSSNITTGSTTLNLVGDNTNGAIILISNDVDFASSWNITITNCYGSVDGGDIGNLTINHTSENAGGNFSVINMTQLGNFIVTDSTLSGMIIFHEQCKVIGDALYQETGPGNIGCYIKGLTYFGNITLDKGVGGGTLGFSADTLNKLPILLNGATYDPDRIADAMNANLYFNPVNFSPVSGGPGLWAADSVVGNLAGIDAALSGAIGVPPAYGEMYFQDNVSTTTIGGANTPVKINATYNSGLLNDFTQLNGTLTYTGSSARNVQVVSPLTCYYDGTSQNTSFYIAKNGSVIAKSKQKEYIGPDTNNNKPITVSALVDLVNGDTLEAWIENNDNTNSPIVNDLNFNLHNIASFNEGSFIEIINGMTITGSGGVNAGASLVASHEIKAGNIVTGSFKISFNPDTNNPFFTIGKSYGGAFTTSDQAIGSGVCSQTPTPVLGDGEVTSIISVTTFGLRTNILVGTLNVNYILECNFTYEVI